MTDEQRQNLRLAMRSLEDLGRVLQGRIEELRDIIRHATKTEPSVTPRPVVEELTGEDE